MKLLSPMGDRQTIPLPSPKKYLANIIHNPLTTAESGKALGLINSHGKYIALIDSDNILPAADWLSTMIYPLDKDSQLIGSEPIEFTYRPAGGYIERYSALIGANDPYAFFSGVSDRRNHLNNHWTELKIPEMDCGSYLKITLQPHRPIPTLGANGTIFRRSFIMQTTVTDYLFDIDIITNSLNTFNKKLYFAKVKTGIIHTYCESSITKFYRKQNRRVRDYFFYKNKRSYTWSGLLLFTKSRQT